MEKSRTKLANVEEKNAYSSIMRNLGSSTAWFLSKFYQQQTTLLGGSYPCLRSSARSLSTFKRVRLWQQDQSTKKQQLGKPDTASFDLGSGHRSAA